MTKISYEVVEHDGGWAYRADGSYSETFATHAQATAAANRAAAEQRTPGETGEIAFQDSSGSPHEEVAKGSDRPETQVVDGD